MLCFLVGVHSQEVNKSIENFISDPFLKNASISFEIVAVDNDSVVSSYYSEKSLVPASTMKLITTATALEVFGKDHQVNSQILFEIDGIQTCLLIICPNYHQDLFSHLLILKYDHGHPQPL